MDFWTLFHGQIPQGLHPKCSPHSLRGDLLSGLAGRFLHFPTRLVAGM
jgi:hypothetical protein